MICVPFNLENASVVIELMDGPITGWPARIIMPACRLKTWRKGRKSGNNRNSALTIGSKALPALAVPRTSHTGTEQGKHLQCLTVAPLLPQAVRRRWHWRRLQGRRWCDPDFRRNGNRPGRQECCWYRRCGLWTCR